MKGFSKKPLIYFIVILSLLFSFVTCAYASEDESPPITNSVLTYSKTL